MWMQAFNRLVSQDECRNQGMGQGELSARQLGPPFPPACCWSTVGGFGGEVSGSQGQVGAEK
jgi:hypothetical protein